MLGWRGLQVAELLDQMAGTDPAAVWLAATGADSLVSGDWLSCQLSYANRGWDVALGTVTVTDWEDLPQIPVPI
jgi:DMSO/TMAO reductase YedYZ molybdopterin-dependent catalytic subunit